MKKRYEIVSLGLNCLPRTILTAGNVKPSKREGELTGPFDIVIHPLKTVIQSIQDDFQTYCDDIYFEPYKCNIFDFRNHGYWKKPDGTIFVHEKRLKKREDVLDVINRRINNFRKIINSETPILFILFIRDKNDRELVNTLYDVLKAKIQHKAFKLAVLDFYGISSLNYYPEIKLLNMEEPIENYHNNWNRKYFKNNPLGIYISKTICSFVTNILETEF